MILWNDDENDTKETSMVRVFIMDSHIKNLPTIALIRIFFHIHQSSV